MTAGKNAVQETLSDLASRMSSGLLGKITPFFMLGLIFGVAAMGALPDEIKIYGFWFGVCVLVVYSVIAGFITIAHPILGALDGEPARKALRDAMTAKHPEVIQGKSRPVSLNMPAKGIGGSLPAMELSKDQAQ